MMNMKMILRSEDSFRHFLLKACVYIGFPLYVLISVYTCTCIKKNKKHPYTCTNAKIPTKPSAF